jgi:hypothetical protein
LWKLPRPWTAHEPSVREKVRSVSPFENCCAANEMVGFLVTLCSLKMTDVTMGAADSRLPTVLARNGWSVARERSASLGLMRKTRAGPSSG